MLVNIRRRVNCLFLLSLGEFPTASQKGLEPSVKQSKVSLEKVLFMRYLHRDPFWCFAQMSVSISLAPRHSVVPLGSLLGPWLIGLVMSSM
jgi:hypothetical protein